MSSEEVKVNEIVEAGDGDDKDKHTSGEAVEATSTSADEKGSSDNGESDKKPNGEIESARKSSGKSTPSTKPGSPASPRISSAISIDQRRVRADELRKKKVDESRKKDDERRAAVAERKRRIDEEERQKREALLKKLEVNVAPQRRLVNTKRDRPLSASMSNLQHLHKTSHVAKSVDISGKNDKPKSSHADSGPPKRPSSAMSGRRHRTSSGDPPLSSRKSSFGSTGSGDSKSGTRAKAPEQKSRTSTRAPEMPQRPVSAMPSLGRPNRTKDDRKSAPGLKKATNVQALPGKPTIPSSSSTSSKTTQLQHKAPTKAKSASNLSTSRPSTASKAGESKTGNKDVEGAKKSSKETTRPSSRDSDKSSKEDSNKAGITSEEEAKKALAERRKKAKEEAEKKAALDKQKREEEERIAREEEEKRQQMIAEMEAERLRHEEQIRLEDEENMRKAAEIRERREREEREKLEIEQKLREEEIERKAKEELERKTKERELTRQQEEAARLERRKRVEEIMKKVVSNKSDEGGEGAERPDDMRITGDYGQLEARLDSPVEEETNGESARDRVGKILQKAKESDVKGDLLEEKNNNKNEEEENLNTENGLDESTTVNHSADSVEIVSSSVRVEETTSITVTTTMNGDLNSADSTVHVVTEEKTEPTDDQTAEDQVETTKQLWQSAEETMIERKALIQSALESKGIIATESGENPEEGKLWQVAEGRIELEECF